MGKAYFRVCCKGGGRFRNMKCAKVPPYFTRKEEFIMTKEFLEKRYKPGRRENSFYMDMPGSAKSKEYAIYSRDFTGYSYHIDKATGSLVRDVLK